MLLLVALRREVAFAEVLEVQALPEVLQQGQLLSQVLQHSASQVEPGTLLKRPKDHLHLVSNVLKVL